MTRRPWRLDPPGPFCLLSSIHLPYHASENPTPPTMFRAGRRVASCRPRRQFAPRRAAQHVRLVVFHHVPYDRRQPTHYRHPRDLRSPTPLDPPIPGLHPRVASQDVQDHLAEDEPRHGAALFGDRAEPVGCLARVAAAGRQAPVVRQARRPRKPFDRPIRDANARLPYAPQPGIVATTAAVAFRACRFSISNSSLAICSSHSFHWPNNKSISSRSIGPSGTVASHLRVR